MTPRRFEPGFSATYEYLQYYCLGFGYELVRVRCTYRLRKRGESGRSRSFNWRGVLRAIDDQIGIVNGHEPILRRASSLQN